MRVGLDQYFMDIAKVVAKRSTCLHRQVGALIVKGKQIISTGYNGAPSGLPHCKTCARSISGQNMELCRGTHAEQNAINFAARYGISIEGATLYTTHFPCSWCAKSIINSGIVKVVYGEDYPDELAKEILADSDIVVEIGK